MNLSGMNLNPVRLDLETANLKQIKSVNRNEVERTNENASFVDVITAAIQSVSDQQIRAESLMLAPPDTVEAHKVTLAMSKVELAMSMTKSIIDRSVKAYNDITGMR